MDDWFDRAFSERTVDTTLRCPLVITRSSSSTTRALSTPGEGTGPRGPSAGQHGTECHHRHPDQQPGGHDEFGQFDWDDDGQPGRPHGGT